LSEFLKDHRAEVENMLYTEFNLDTALEVRAEEVREETDAKWQAVVADIVADKDAELADLRAKLAELQPS
jgi:L-rhamnose mutarotase